MGSLLPHVIPIARNVGTFSNLRGYCRDSRCAGVRVRAWNMLQLIFILPDGTEKLFRVHSGENVMDVAVSNEIDGISANCRGNCACSTCHVYVEPEWLERVGTASGMEEDILDFAPDARSESRLCCQLTMSKKLDGLRLRIPDWQRWN